MKVLYMIKLFVMKSSALFPWYQTASGYRFSRTFAQGSSSDTTAEKT
jgi:hypothetical protein